MQQWWALMVGKTVRTHRKKQLLKIGICFYNLYLLPKKKPWNKKPIVKRTGLANIIDILLTWCAVTRIGLVFYSEGASVIDSCAICCALGATGATNGRSWICAISTSYGASIITLTYGAAARWPTWPSSPISIYQKDKQVHVNLKHSSDLLRIPYCLAFSNLHSQRFFMV